jgi:pseudouridine-5'-monophosphatase
MDEDMLAGLPVGAPAEGELVEENTKVGTKGNGWGELRDSLVGFDYARYGIRIGKYD